MKLFKIKFRNFPYLRNLSNQQLLGIDLSGNNLKIVCVEVSLNKTEVTCILSYDITNVQDEGIIKLIKNAQEKLNLKEPYVINIIPAHLVITKNIEIPSIIPEEIKQIINLQASRHTPYSREEIIVDYINIGTYKNNYTRVVLVIVSRSAIKRQIEIIERAGLKPQKVFLSAEGMGFALGKIFKIDTELNPVGVVHLDENFSDFIVIFKNKPIFIRSISLGAQQILSSPEGYELRFIEEIKRSLEAYQSEEIERIPQNLILTGVEEGVEKLRKVLFNSIYIPIKTLSYLKSILVRQEILRQDELFRRLSFFDLIASLFSQEKMCVDLTLDEIKLKRTLEEKAKELVKTGILVLAIFILIFSILISKIYFKSLYLKKLSDKYRATNQEAELLQDNIAKISIIKNYLSSRGFSLEVLNELYNLLPLDIKLSDIRFDAQGKFVIQGTSESMSSIFSFVENMEKSKYFKDVKIKYTTKRKEELKDFTDFEINTLLVK